MAYGEDPSPMELHLKVQTEPMGFGLQVCMSNFAVELNGAQKVRLVDHVGDFFADLGAHPDPPLGRRKSVVRLGALRLRVDPEEAMALLMLLEIFSLSLLDPELYGDPWPVPDEFEGAELRGWAHAQVEPIGVESDWPLLQVSCTDPVTLLLPGTEREKGKVDHASQVALQPLVVSFCFASEDVEDLRGMRFQLRDVTCFSSSPSVSSASHLARCETISISLQQQDLVVLAPHVQLTLHPLELALVTRHVRRWGTVRQDAAPLWERRSSLSSSFGSCDAGLGSPRDWHVRLQLQLPELDVQLASNAFPVLCASVNWQTTMELDGQLLLVRQSCDSLRVADPISERELVRLQQPSQLVVNVPFDSIKEQVQWRGRLAPSFISVDCIGLSKILEYLKELQEVFGMLGLEDVDPILRGSLLSDWENCLQNVDLHVTCSQLNFFLPSSSILNASGILFSCGAWCSFRQLHGHLALTKLSACEATWAELLQLGGTWQTSKDAQILHPCRLKADVDLALEPPSLTGRVDFSPISVSLKTEHVPLFRRIWHYLHALDGELAGFGEDFDWTSSSSPQKPRSSEYSEGHRTWQARSAELRQLGEVLQELFPSSLVLALRHSAHLLKTCRLQLDVELGAMHLGLVQSSTDAELCVVLVEDVGFSVDRAALVAQGFSSPLSAPSPASSCLSPARPQGPRRREHLAGHVILSVDITSTELARSSTLLEPVCFMFNLFKGIKHQPSTCKVSWVNLNLSSSLIDTLVSLYHDAMERTAGASSPSPSRPDDVVEPERRERLGLLPPTETLEATRAASAADLEASAAMLVARSSEESLNSQGRSLKRQVSISSRQPQLRVVNLLGQDITLDLLYSADGRRSKEFPIFSGSSRIVTMPWCGCGAPRAGSGWMAKLQLQQIPDAEVFLHLTATSAVKSVSAKPSKPSRTQSMSSSFLGSQMRCYSADTSGSNLDLSYKLTSLPESWILVRTEVGDKLHELDVHFSSVLFVENRTALSLSVAPYGTPPEGFLELPARSEPQPIPLAWLAHSSLWLGVTEELKMPSLNSSGSSLSFGAVLSGNTDPDKRGWMRAQRRRGILQPMIGKTTWQAIRRYRSMVANDYFLRSRMLHLSDRMGESCASLCATVCGVSADLQASLQALIFSVALEPAAQICNRLPCPMTLASLDGPLVIPPGEDVDIVKPSQLHITLEVAPCTGAVDEEPLTLHLETPLWADRLPREKHQKRLHFSEVNVQGKEADQIAKLMVSLETEPGLTMSEYWSPLQVRQYSPRSLRLVFFTQYWLLNRRSDCRVCLPQPELGATRATGVAKFASRRPAGSVDSSKRLALMQYDCNTLRMVSESLVRRGKIRVGLCDQRYNANGESLVPVTEPIRINQPTAGSATAPRSAFNPVQRCFGYTVRPAPLPFHRTLLVEVVRRYTLLNHKEHVLYCFEKDTSTSFVALSANGSAAFDPQRSGPRAVAISGVAPQSAMLELLERRPRASTVPPDRREHGRDPPGRRSVTWATENWSEGEADVELGRCEDTEQQDFSSAPFVLESSRRSFQLMHLCDLSHWSAHALSASSSLARAEPLRPEPLPAPSGIGWAWCLTQVDTLVEQSSVVVRFSEPLRPQFRILNRTGHGLGLRQDCDRAPGFELAPEHRMSFCWFQPEGPLKLRLRLGAQEISYDVGTVQEHSPPLRVERPAGGTGSAHGDVSAFVGVVREEFLVQTKVVRGSREVHIHPHCLLKNAKGHALLVRSGHKNTEMVVPHEGSVCLQRESKASEQVVLEIATCVPGSSAHWSAPIMLTKSLAGQRGFVRHMKSGGSGMTSVFEITMVDVKKDPISDFLVVELRPYVKANCPYFFENVSQQVCSVSQLEGPDAGAPLDLFPGESAPFVPVGALICGQGTFPVRLAVLGAEDEIRYSTVIDIELPQEAVFGAMRVKVLKERPRHIVIRDAEIKPRKNSKGLKHHLPPFVFLQRMLGSKKPKPKPRPSPTARHLSPRRKTRMISPGLSPRRRRPTLPLQMLAGTPRLTAMPSTRSLTSRISKLRRSSLGIFWTIQGRKRCQRLRGTVLELYAQGAGVTLVDSTSLNEVAYFCADSLVVDMVKYEGAQRALEIKLGSLQLDVHDNSAGWRSNVMVRPKRSRLPARVREGRPFLDISATWLALERGAGFAAHLEVENLKIEMQPLELRLDTLSCFQLAIFGLDLLRRAEPLLAALPMFGHLRRQLKTRWRSDGEELLVASQGDGHDPVVGEPPCPEYDDFDVPTPVFIKELLVRRIQLFVSVRFNGKASASGNCSSEALQAVDIVLRKLIPFDVSQARLSLGPFFRRRPGAPAPKGCRLFRMLLLGEQQSDALLADEFLPHGFHELFSEASSAAGDAVLRQIPQFVGAQRLLGSPAHLWTELTQALHLAVFGLCSCSPWLLIAALLTVIAAVLESVEGIFMIIAKQLGIYLTNMIRLT
ncbi:unnamed protein product, partial [Durusdinium trenchii]